MSRDPEDGNARIPASLHKYLYADGDPIDGVDPTGRTDFIESIFTKTYISSPLEVNVEAYGKAVAELLCGVADYLAIAFKYWPANATSPLPVPVWSIKLADAFCKGLPL